MLGKAPLLSFYIEAARLQWFLLRVGFTLPLGFNDRSFLSPGSMIPIFYSRESNARTFTPLFQLLKFTLSGYTRLFKDHTTNRK
jgi:hypothetical protein